MKRALILLALVVAIAASVPGIGNSTEYRGLWIDGWHAGMWTATEINTMLNTAQTGRYNTIVPQIRMKGDALYNSTYGGPSGTGEPKPSAVSPPSFDPLAYMVQEAHARGMKVMPWVCTHRVPTQTYDWFYGTHNNWLTKENTGALSYAEGYWLDPGVPDGEEYTINVIMDIVTRYDIDGIQWDRIRYPGNTSGYNTIAITRFQQEKGYYPAYNDTTFSNWRRQQLNNFVARAYAQIMEVKPQIAVCANSWISYSSGNSSYFQDANAWMYNHWLDINVPMNYTSSRSSFDDYLQDWLNRRYGRYVYSGMNVGTSGQTQSNAVNEILDTRTYNTGSGVPWGCQTYSYYHGTVTSPGWFTYVSGTGKPYQSVDLTVPTLPWKTGPTTGIVMGRVTDATQPNDPIYHNWINRAYVWLYHPDPPEVSVTMYTDPTGYFVFNDVEPRNGYTITISKAPYDDIIYTNQSLSAGEVLREDAGLGTMTCTSPAGAVRAGWNLISLPLKPVSTNPATVFSGIDIDNHLFKWHNPTQSLKAYDVWDPANFGTVSDKEGYWLEVPSDATIHYNANVTTPASQDISVPSAGWSIMGCPFLTAQRWEDAEVTQGTTKLPLRTAASAPTNWLASQIWGWNNETQSLYDVDLPEFFPSSETIDPWHGYWLQTKVNNLTLTLQ